MENFNLLVLAEKWKFYFVGFGTESQSLSNREGNFHISNFGRNLTKSNGSEAIVVFEKTTKTDHHGSWSGIWKLEYEN